MHVRHVANTLGALALSVTDRMTSSSGAAALTVLLQDDGLGVSDLGRRVGLSQPAAARMVDSLEARGLVRRRRESGRRTAVHLTTAGTRAARQVLVDRHDGLASLVETLTAEEQRVLGGLLDRLLLGVHDRVGDADLVCRLCDREGCTEAGTRCPVGWAARRG